MAIATQKYIRKPLYVDAVRVSARNFEEMAAWCQGEIKMDENAKRFIKVRVQNPKNPRQTKAMVGDWILYTETGYKVYTNKAFLSSFDLVGVETEAPQIQDSAGVTVLGRECFVSLDESVISYKGENYYPRNHKSIAETAEEERRRALEEAYRLEREKGSPTLLEPNITPPIAAEPPKYPEPEFVEATPQAIVQAAIDTEAAKKAEGPTPTQSDTAPPARDNGHRVISVAEQQEMDPDEIKGLLQAGAVLAQDLV